MDLGLTGKTALITGSTAGIGLAIAQSLAAEGAHVTLNGRTQPRVDAAIAAIHTHTPAANVAGIVADLATPAGAATIAAALPAVDILVNNVAIFTMKPFPGLTDADWLNIFEVNVMSGVRLARHYLPAMLAGNWGRILFISSESAVQIPVEAISYGVSKTAQVALARGLAESVAGTGVTVNSVLPGPTASEGMGSIVAAMAAEQHKSAAEIEQDFFAHMRPSSLLKRFATTQEVASVVTYLASPLSSATNGAALRVDGGVIKAIL
jgi:NAD(P)-dependent dehydrogenase (short-subunit alcohol dehydrogenase family)